MNSSNESNGTFSGRNIVLCLDGTKNQFSSTNSNLIKLFSILQVNDNQLVYYDSGVGTYLGMGQSWWTGFKKWLALTADLAFAWNFKDHVMNAYIYLMNEYRDGDRIFIFGFSRGAYAARALAGMLAKIGLLPKGNLSQIPLAWEVYANPVEAHAKAKLGECDVDVITGTPAEYKQTFSRQGATKNINVHFVGVWDTVSALGISNLPNLPFASVVGDVTYFRQALALDERRAKFQPEYWHREAKPEKDAAHWITYTKNSKGLLDALREEGSAGDMLRRISSGHKQSPGETASSSNNTIELESSEFLRKTVNGILAVKECWFSGVHSDIGGGNTLNGLPTLSNISLRWMIRDAQPLGLLIDPVALFRSPVYNYSYPEIRQLIPPQFINFRFEDERKRAVEEWNAKNPTGTAIKVDFSLVDVSEIIQLTAELDARPFEPPYASSGSEIRSLTRVDELGEDLAEDRHESLTGFYKLLEWIPLQRWIYVESTGDSRKDTRKLKRVINMGRPRQMLHTQRIHRSVLHKLAFERYSNQLDNKIDKDARGVFTSPKATPADGKTWEELLDVPADRSRTWEF